MSIFHFSDVFTSHNKVMLKKYGKYPILKISKISDIFEFDKYRIYITDIANINRANPVGSSRNFILLYFCVS